MQVGDKVTWQGWGRIGHSYINCKGVVIKILSIGPTGWSLVQKRNGAKKLVQNKELTKI